MTGRSIGNRVDDVNRQMNAIGHWNARWLGEGLRWFFVLLLGASAIGKLADMPGFLEIVTNYQALPPSWVPLASWLLVVSEAVLSAAFAFGPTIVRRHGEAGLLKVIVQGRFAALCGLHVLYLIWLLRALMSGRSIPNCGCFGVYLPRPLTLYSVIEDGVLLLMAALLWRLRKPKA
jgi:Methylamine utilisation protein MauE